MSVTITRENLQRTAYYALWGSGGYLFAPPGWEVPTIVVCLVVLARVPRRSLLTKPLPSLPPAVVPISEPPPSVPAAFEPHLEVWQLMSDILSCSRVCENCPYYRKNERIQCAKLDALAGSMPRGNPYIEALESNSGLLRSAIYYLQTNNELRLREEARENPVVKWPSVALGAMLIVLVQQVVVFFLGLI